jgi:hypothetical protein
VIYVFPSGGATLYLDSLKPLDNPSSLSSDIQLPPEYQEAIVYNLAIRMAPEFGKSVSAEVSVLASAGMTALQTKNFSSQINAIKVDPIHWAGVYNIDEG